MNYLEDRTVKRRLIITLICLLMAFAGLAGCSDDNTVSPVAAADTEDDGSLGGINGADGDDPSGSGKDGAAGEEEGGDPEGGEGEADTSEGGRHLRKRVGRNVPTAPVRSKTVPV